MRLKWLIAIIISAITLLGIGLTVRFLQTGGQVPETNIQSTPNISGDALIIGNKDAPITMIEYADFKCPDCGKYHSDVGKRIRQNYVDTGKVKIEFRPYPVFGSDGGRALAGSYCAQQQGKFIQYHDALFAYMWDNHFKKGDFQKAVQTVLTDDVMTSILASVGIDKVAYNTCLDNPKTKETFDVNLLKAAPDEIQGTPSFIINGRKLVGNQPYEVFETLLRISQ